MDQRRNHRELRKLNILKLKGRRKAVSEGKLSLQIPTVRKERSQISELKVHLKESGKTN